MVPLTEATPPVRILLVDDNPGDVLLFQMALKRSPVAAEVSVAEDGEKAWLLLESQHVDLIVLDLNLPKINGFEVLKTFRESGNSQVPILILSSSRNPGDMDQAMLTGANGYAVKGADFESYTREVEVRILPWVEAIAKDRDRGSGTEGAGV